MLFNIELCAALWRLAAGIELAEALCPKRSAKITFADRAGPDTLAHLSGRTDRVPDYHYLEVLHSINEIFCQIVLSEGACQVEAAASADQAAGVQRVRGWERRGQSLGAGAVGKRAPCPAACAQRASRRRAACVAGPCRAEEAACPGGPSCLGEEVPLQAEDPCGARATPGSRTAAGPSTASGGGGVRARARQSARAATIPPPCAAPGRRGGRGGRRPHAIVRCPRAAST